MNDTGPLKVLHFQKPIVVESGGVNLRIYPLYLISVIPTSLKELVRRKSVK